MPDGPPPLPQQGPILTAAKEAIDTSFVRTDGKVLEVGLSAQPPTEYCIKSGQPALSVKVREFTYFHPALYLAVFAGVLPFLILVLLFRKTIRFEVGLCAHHHKMHLLKVSCGIIGSFLGLGILFYSLAVEKYSLALIGVALFFFVGVPGILLSRLLIPVKIDDQRGVFKGASSAYLNRIQSQRD